MISYAIYDSVLSLTEHFHSDAKDLFRDQ